MALTIEDGTNVSGADSYLSVVDADTYHADRGNSTWTGTDTAKEVALRRATVVLDSYNWMGLRTNGRSQPLQWPRVSVWDKEGLAILSNEIPQEIKDAVAEVALRELVTPGTMTPDVVIADKVKSERIGDISVEYANVKTGVDASIPVLTLVQELIGDFLSQTSSSVAGSTYRV